MKRPPGMPADFEPRPNGQWFSQARGLVIREKAVWAYRWWLYNAVSQKESGYRTLQELLDGLKKEETHEHRRGIEHGR